MLHEALNSADDDHDATTERILSGALGQLEDFGLRRTTMEDVARRVGVSRVTIYRRFAGKEALVTAVILRELRLFLAELDAVIAGYDATDARLAAGFAFTLDRIRTHQLLTRLLTTEPESLLPHLTTEAGPVVETARTFLADRLGREVEEGRLPPLDVEVAAELLVRLALSFVITPASVVELETPDDARRFARRYLVPALRSVARERA